MTQTAHGPITNAPLRVRPPYDQRDIAGEQGQNETVHQWWDRRRVDGIPRGLLNHLGRVPPAGQAVFHVAWLSESQPARIGCTREGPSVANGPGRCGTRPGRPSASKTVCA